MSGQHGKDQDPAASGTADLDALLRDAQGGILAKITESLDIRAGLAAIILPAAVPLRLRERTPVQQADPPAAPHGAGGFEVGEPVTITGGPFAEYPATISAIDPAARKLRVLISMFGQPTPIEVAFDQVARVRPW